ncbi:MAG: cell division protein FtsL [SAR324 cluster bacterium]|nr:cell division protein FtsL [SAR324 cluster bacterium]
MDFYTRRSSTVRQQQKWWHIPTVLFAPKYSFWVISFAIFLIAGGSLSYLWQWANYLQLGYRTQALEKEKVVLQQSISLLEIEVHFLSRLERLDRIATSRMNMRPPKPTQRFILTAPKPNE